MRRMRLLRSSIWLTITFLPDRWRTRKQPEQPSPASAISMDGVSGRLAGSATSMGSKQVTVYDAQPRWLGDPRRCFIADCLLLILAAVTVAVCLVDTHSIARLLLVLVAACLIPGSALLTRLPGEDVLEALGLAVGLGFCIEAAGALAMVWTGWWHPFGWALALVTAACVMFFLDLRRIVVPVRETL
jgi:hypothetical protein